jgi:hypothetical protein
MQDRGRLPAVIERSRGDHAYDFPPAPPRNLMVVLIAAASLEPLRRRTAPVVIDQRPLRRRSKPRLLGYVAAAAVVPAAVLAWFAVQPALSPSPPRDRVDVAIAPGIEIDLPELPSVSPKPAPAPKAAVPPPVVEEERSGPNRLCQRRRAVVAGAGAGRLCRGGTAEDRGYARLPQHRDLDARGGRQGTDRKHPQVHGRRRRLGRRRRAGHGHGGDRRADRALSSSHTRIALARFAGLSASTRAASIRATSALSGSFSSAAASRSASQKAGSRLIEVAWPATITDRFTGPAEPAPFIRIKVPLRSA